MKKIAYFIQLLLVTLLFSSTAVAHDRDWGRHGHGWGHSHHGWGGYPRQRVGDYYPQPQANYYYQHQPEYYQPRPQYYPTRPQYNYGGGRFCENRYH